MTGNRLIRTTTALSVPRFFYGITPLVDRLKSMPSVWVLCYNLTRRYCFNTTLWICSTKDYRSLLMTLNVMITPHSGYRTVEVRCLRSYILACIVSRDSISRAGIFQDHRLTQLFGPTERKSWSSSFWWSFAEVNMAFIIRLCSLPPFAALFVCLDESTSRNNRAVAFIFNNLLARAAHAVHFILSWWFHRDLTDFRVFYDNLMWDLWQGFVKWVPHWVLKLLECFCVFLGNVRH